MGQSGAYAPNEGVIDYSNYTNNESRGQEPYYSQHQSYHPAADSIYISANGNAAENSDSRYVLWFVP